MEHLVEEGGFYQMLMDCRTDKDLEKMIRVEKREQFFSRIAGERWCIINCCSGVRSK